MRNRVSAFGCCNWMTIRAKASTLPAWKGWRTPFARMPGMAIVLFACLAVLARPVAAQVFDDFESYAVGSNLHGQGGWAGWMGNASAGALVSTNFSFSPIRSVNINGASDLVHTFSGATNGQWVFRVMQYIPSSSTGVSYVILMNTYQAPYGTSNLSWSVQIPCNLATGQIISDYGGGATLPMLKDQWVEFRCEINLSSNSVSEFYNGQLLSTHLWQGGGGGPGLNEIQALDLFANNAGPVYYDNVSLTSTVTAQQCCGTWGLVQTNGPSPRQHHAMAYDSARHVVVLFGGSDSSSYKGDTWEWDGVNWALIPTTTSPSPRNEHAMAYDSNRGVVVLFGGGNDNSPEAQGETWEYPVAGQWVRRANSAGPGATTGPSPRVRHAMAYDSTRQRVVLFGGYAGGS